MTKSFHPSDTVQLVHSHKIDNFALRYRHFLKITEEGPKYKVNFQDSEQMLESSSQNLVEQLRERQKQQLLHFARRGIELYCLEAMVDWRLVVGLGSDHVQETNMTLHHIYGIPYIPGSAVKGVLRHWWLQEDFGHNEEKALDDAGFRTLFGSPKQRGHVQFLDAYPKKVRFATEIMNPHYPAYYSGSKPPTDSQNPLPIPFLTVEKTSFRFIFLAKEKGLLNTLQRRFEDVLAMKGIGAKTAVGYGYFRNFNDRTNDIIDELKCQQQAAQEEAKKEQEAKHLASLSPVERLAEELTGLSDSSVDEERVTYIYNKELPLLEEAEKQVLARALKEYWQRINKWSGGSKKQKAKVQAVKAILEES